MTQNEIFKIIQTYVSDVPLLLVGTGVTIPYGIPGMKELSDHIIGTLDKKYKGNSQWDKFISNIKSGKDLESALADLPLTEQMLNDIIIQTWQLVNRADLELFNKIINQTIDLPIAKLLQKLYQSTPQCVNIITTNYDRIIEYACDRINVNVDKRFVGQYLKTFSRDKLQNRQIINLVKVHGSLDLFKDKDGFVYSIPLQSNIPIGFIPEIVTPGENKYRSILTGECRDLVHIADNLINVAKCFLCIGYGFNDAQIQRNIIKEINQGKPIVIVTKEFSEKSKDLIKSNSKKHAIIQVNKDNLSQTEFIINGSCFTIDGDYWSLDKFMDII